MFKIIKQLFFFLLFCSFSIDVNAMNMRCNEQGAFVEFQGHYYTTTVRRYTYEEAQKFAKENNGYLAIPNSQAENSFIASLAPAGNYAWIGIYDPSQTANYCYENKPCSNSTGRFRTVKGGAVSFMNWDRNEPNNLVYAKDIIYDEYSKESRSVVIPIGEHWVAITKQGVWADLGNHAGEITPRKEYAILEFDSLPKCANGIPADNNDVALDIKSAEDKREVDVGIGIGANNAGNNGWNSDGSCGGQIYIFSGQDNRCRSKDKFAGLSGGGCCDKDKVFLGLVSCKEHEKALAEKNKEKLCVEIGEYCSKSKKFIGCIQHSKSYCCFNSMLARIFNEQGRRQIGKGWGSPSSPHCRGFSVEEFQKLDFSKIDLTEFINTLTVRVNDSFAEKQLEKIRDKVNQNINSMKPYR
ncbi:conjugal transfer protein TraN [Helicobacter colisuis]|uniref:conjugal transfer protein TraN n=1 Tax=Helicobacter colisuis TaxID=2949739 RepID=UPI002029C7F8|nr:conjugal transfer protein TraN [Helicobacter colisuis]MCL9823408.1 conjugal transfer protein TraN [Helicobacter colisuis]